MGNKGAFITLKGKDMKPNFTTYEAVVSIIFCKENKLLNLRDNFWLEKYFSLNTRLGIVQPTLNKISTQLLFVI